MDDFFPLRKPLQSQVTIDSVAKPCPSEGFNVRIFLSFYFDHAYNPVS
jgi:hypothetical protein